MEIKYRNIGINKWQLEKIPGMGAEAVFYAKKEMLEDLNKDLSLSQLADAAMLPGVISPVIGMPDIHEGFGLPIGGVMATEGLISVGAVGMDINCGVRLLTSQLAYEKKDFSPERLRLLINKIVREIPIGVGGERRSLPAEINFENICLNGAQAVINSGFGFQDDLTSIEEGGKLTGAKMEAITPKALKRAKLEIGTLGSGNHFIEIQKLEKIYDKELADKWGLFEGQICIMIHSGSRALGHQTCTDYTEIFWNLE
ncbi:MAG: RtcB family protein, partial [Microgenomates group bacterium]